MFTEIYPRQSVLIRVICGHPELNPKFQILNTSEAQNLSDQTSALLKKDVFLSTVSTLIDFPE